MAEKFKSLTDYIKSNLDEHVGDVVISNKLTKSPCAIVAPEHGISGNMEKMMAAQNLGAEDYMSQYYRRQKKIFEINPVRFVLDQVFVEEKILI